MAAAEAGHLIVSTRKSKREDQEAIVTGPLQLRRLRVSDRADHVTILKQADPERAAELMVSQVVAKGR